MALCPGLPGWAGTRRNIHPPTIVIIIQSLSASSIYHDPQHPFCSNYVLGNLFAQSLSMSSLVCLLVWSPPPHIPYISSPNKTITETINTLFPVVNVLKCVVTEVVCFQLLLLRHLTFHKVVYWHTWGALGSLVIVLLRIFSWFW